MFYSNEMIKNMNYESVEDFVKDHVRKHKNSVIKFIFDGVYFDYDYDSEERTSNFGCSCLNRRR